jgi:hypothetical protein
MAVQSITMPTLCDSTLTKQREATRLWDDRHWPERLWHWTLGKPHDETPPPARPMRCPEGDRIGIC